MTYVLVPELEIRIYSSLLSLFGNFPLLVRLPPPSRVTNTQCVTVIQDLLGFFSTVRTVLALVYFWREAQSCGISESHWKKIQAWIQIDICGHSH
jgi:hypothetical protein